MTDDLTPQGAAAARLAVTVVQLKAERDRARGIAVALEQQVARVEALHRRRRHTANGGSRLGGFDFVGHGQTDFPDLCDHCRTPWPCQTAITLGADQ